MTTPQQDRLIAKRVVEEFLREFCAENHPKEDVFPALVGRLDIDDALFDAWQRLPRRPA